MIGSILPSSVAYAEAHEGVCSGDLLPAEAALVAKAAEKRRHEFSCGRACARAAMATLGVSDCPVLRGPNREPLWPPGIVGAITHCEGYVAAAVASTREILTVGIDAEKHHALPPGLEEVVCTSTERAWYQSNGIDEYHWPTVFFSAKEALYKAWFPLVQCWLGFQDAELSIRPTDGTFTVRLRVSPVPAPFRHSDALEGRFVVTERHILTTIVIPVHGIRVGGFSHD